MYSQNQICSEAQELTATAVSTNVIDLGPIAGTVDREPGKGTPIPFSIQLLEDAGGTSPTLVAKIRQSDSLSSGALVSPETVWSTPTISGGSEGQEIGPGYLPRGVNKRYIDVQYTLTGTSPTYKVFAGIKDAHQSYHV